MLMGALNFTCGLRLFIRFRKIDFLRVAVGLALLDELGRRQMTNILVEGGGRLLGSLFDLQAVDEVHVFVAPVIAGGADAVSAVAGDGVANMSDALRLASVHWEELDGDLYVHGRTAPAG